MIFKRRTPSIFSHLRDHVRPNGPGLLDGGETLPDDAENEHRIWAPGAHDGVLTHHWAGEGKPDEVERLSSALAAGSYDEVYAAAREITIVTVVDDVLAAVRSSGIDPEQCYRLAYRLATQGRHREPVKLGIALLGCFDARHHRDELMTLGRHDEFTLFAAVALENREDDGAEDDLWELARNVRGWGRVQIVERLADTQRPELRAWILREGFRNDVMDEYLAGIAAETGGLADALAGEVDDELLDAAADILCALADGDGPMIGMPGYAEGERATALFLGHMSTRARDLRHFLAIHQLRSYAENEWPDLAARCTEILDRPLWSDVARQDLASTDSAVYFRATRACEILGVPTLRVRLNRLRTRDALDGADWHGAVREAGPDEIDEVLALAEDLLPLDRIGSGPADEMGVGGEFVPHHCLDMVLTGLGSWPGRGTRLVRAALASPVVRNRNTAIRVLDEWGREAWPDGIDGAVTTALSREPEEGVRTRLQSVLDGRPID